MVAHSALSARTVPLVLGPSAEAGAPPFCSPDGVGLQPVYALRYHAMIKLPAELYFWIYWDAGVASSPGQEEVQALFGPVPMRSR